MYQFRKEAIESNKQTLSGTVSGSTHWYSIGEQVGSIIKCFNVCSAGLSKTIPTNLSYGEQ